MANQQVPSQLTATARPMPVAHVRAALARRLRRGARPGAALLAALALLLVADMLALNMRAGGYAVDAGTYRAIFYLGNVFEPEREADGTSYRWTHGQALLRFRQALVAPATLLRLDLGGRPAPAQVRLSFNGQPWLEFTAAAQARSYTFILPQAASGDATIAIDSPTFSVGDDPRALGIKLRRVQLSTPGTGWRAPTLPTLLAQAAILGAALLTLAIVRLPWRARLPLVAALALGLGALLGADLLLAYVYTLRLAVASAALLAISWVGLPVAERALAWAGGAREIRLLWGLAMLACAIRMAGMLYPTFGGQDLFLHTRLLTDIANGQLIHMVISSEFGNGEILYPPGTYLAVVPGKLLIGDQDSLLQGALALLDGTTALLAALLARRLGGNRHAARMALVLYAGSTTAFTVMGYGFSAQLFGQWFAAPIAVTLMSDEWPLPRRAWAGAIAMLLMAVSAHIGVALLLSTWFGIAFLLVLARPHRNMLLAAGLLAVSALFALATLYADGLPSMINHFGQVRDGDAAKSWLPGATPLLWVGMRLAYSGAGLALLPCGLALIALNRRRAQPRLVAAAWLLSVLLFLAADLLLSLQVRYFYFFLPMALAAIGLLLGRLAARGRWVCALAWLMVLFVSGQGVALWFSVVFGDGKLSLTPLTH